MTDKPKKDHGRKERSVRLRRGDAEQPVAGSVTPERGQATSNFTDGEVPGPDHKRDAEGRLKRKPPVSEPRRRG